MGRTKYETLVLPRTEKIALWARRGATEKEIAKKLRLGYSTWRRYLDEAESERAAAELAGQEYTGRYAPLLRALAGAREAADDEVEAALHRRACGGEYEERVYELRPDPETGQRQEVCVRRVVRQLPPDGDSAKFWLANRRSARWAFRPREADGTEQAGGVVELPAVMPGPENGADAASGGGEREE